MKHLKKTQQGRSMIEMIAVLAIIGIITVGVVAGINQGFLKYRTSKTYTEIRYISQNIASLYSYLRRYPDPDDTDTNVTEQSILNTLCENGVFPNTCVKNGANYVNPPNPFGGNYRVELYQYTMTISASSVPPEACQELEGEEWGNYLSGNPDCANEGNGSSNRTFVITFE